MWRLASLLVGGLVMLASGCQSNLHYEHDLEDMVCDSTGCWHCDDDGLCGEYRCEYTHQCPIGRYCSADNRCLPGGDGTSGSGDYCTAHTDCAEGEICTLDGYCVTSPGGGPVADTSTGEEDTSIGEEDTSIGEEDTSTGEEDTSIGEEDTSTGEEDTSDPGLPDHPDDVCTHNADCGLDGVCLNGDCLFPCYLDGTCPPGQYCADGGQCLPLEQPENTCTFNGECGTSHVCLEGTCYQTCSETFECPDHTRCSEGVCVADTTPVIQCSGPASCEEGTGCFDGKCLTTCSADAPCGEAEECAYGYCHQIVTCFDQDDCAGADCLDGTCQ